MTISLNKKWYPASYAELIQRTLLALLLLPSLALSKQGNCVFTLVNNRDVPVHFLHFQANSPADFADIFKNGREIRAHASVAAYGCPKWLDKSANMDVDVVEDDGTNTVHLSFRPYIGWSDKGFVITLQTRYGDLVTRLWLDEIVNIPPY